MQEQSSMIRLKVNEAADTLSTYMINLSTVESLKNVGKNSFMLWGPPGIGKSDMIKTLQKRLHKSTGKEVVITDVRLLLFNPVDLRGIPVPDVSRQFAIWLKPEIFKMDSSDKIINILMLDEISAAPPSVQAAAYQLTLDRKIGEHKLPDNCFVVCAGNRMQDKSVAYKMPKALANRLTHFEIYSEYDDWKKWALNKGIDSRIIAFLKYKESALYQFDSSSDDCAFATPRTWEMTDNYLKIFGSLDAAFNCIAGCIGQAMAGEFRRYCMVFDKIPNVDDIFAGKDVTAPEAPDVLTALSATISARIGKTSDKKQLSNVMKWITKKMPEEYSVLTVKDAVSIDGVQQKFIQLPEWLTWAKEKRNLIV